MDTKWKRYNRASAAQLLRFIVVLMTNPLLAVSYGMEFHEGLLQIVIAATCSLICVFFVCWMFVCTGCVEGHPEEIALGEAGRLPTEVLALWVLFFPLMSIIVWSALFGSMWKTAVPFGTAGGGLALLCLLALARKWKAGRLVSDMLLVRALPAFWHGLCAVLRVVRGALTGHDSLDLHYPAGRAWFLRILWVCGAMAGLMLFSYLILTNQLLGTGKGYWFGQGRYTAFAIFSIVVVFCGAAYLVWHANRDARAFDALLRQIGAAGRSEEAPVCVPEGSGLFAASQSVAELGSHLKESVDAQLKSERMKLDLITNVSHDLKTPLTSVIGYLDLLEKQDGMPAEARDYVLILRQKSERLATTVADLFTLAKATSGSEAQHIETLDLVMASRQTLGDLDDAIRKAGIPVKATMPARAPVQADSTKLYRVLQNILDNALRYSLAGTRIYLEITRGDIATRLTLTNTASYEMTFSPEEITQRFVRGDASRTTEGSGLGLSIAETFMHNFGGDLAVEVRGDAFVLTLTFANGESADTRSGETALEVFGRDLPEEVEEAPEEEETAETEGEALEGEDAAGAEEDMPEEEEIV